MKTFPLQSLTLIEAQQKQFALVDTICRHFPGADFLAGGDLGLATGLNQPRVTQRVEKVLAEVAPSSEQVSAGVVDAEVQDKAVLLRVLTQAMGRGTTLLVNKR